MKINDLNNRADLTLVTNGEDVAAINAEFGESYDSYFVSVEDGDYGEVYGFYGCIAYLHKEVYRVK